jgi:hypothetical protein
MTFEQIIPMPKHPRTAMIDLLEDLRLTIRMRDPKLTQTQVLVALAACMEDVTGAAFQEVSEPKEE